MEQLPILSMIKREMARKRINASDLSRGLKMNHSSVAGMLKRPTLQVQRLAELSEFLNYKLFQGNSSQTPLLRTPMWSTQQKQTTLQNRIKELEMEVRHPAANTERFGESVM